VERLIVWNSNDAIALRGEPASANDISIYLWCGVVLSTINLDDQRTIMRDEVEDVASKRNLAAEAESIEAVRPQRIPKLSLRARHRSPKRPRFALPGF
jgi:hypothetical protein